MAFYSSSNVKTEILDPVYFSSNDRVEFRLDKGTIMNNMKLANFGLTGAGGHRYNVDGGVLSMIKEIHLYDGKTTLQSQFHANERFSFENSQNTNDYNSNVERFTLKHQQGYSVQPKLDVVGKSVNVLNSQVSGIPTVDDPNNKNKGYIQVSHLLPILKVLPVLPSSIFTQLRLIVVFETDPRKLLTGTANPVQTIKPVLIVDRITSEIQEQKLISKLTNALFNDYEYTQINCPVNTAGIQSVNKKTLAFNNKFLKRLRIKLNYQNEASYVSGSTVLGRGALATSLNMHERTIQYRVNGSNILPRNIQGDNRRLALFCDTWGNINITPEMCSSLASSTQNGVMVADDNIGCKDMDGVHVNQVIEELELQIGRTFLTDTTIPSKYNDEMKIVVEGEIQKQINFGNGGYIVGYVS